MLSPFAASKYGDMQLYHYSATDRLHAVKSFNLEQCKAALELTDLQKTVRVAVERRMRKLEKEAA